MKKEKKNKTLCEKKLSDKYHIWTIATRDEVFKEELTYKQLLKKYKNKNIVARCVSF